MKKWIAFFTLFFIKSLHADTMTMSLAPIVLPTYTDITVNAEFILLPSSTVTGFFNKSSKDCPDCQHSGKSSGIGLGAMYRFYFNNATVTSMFFELGLARFNGKAQDEDSDKTVKKTVWEKSLAFGSRNFFYNSAFYEWKVGLIDRSHEIKAGKYVGYRKTTPVIGLAIGLKF